MTSTSTFLIDILMIDRDHHPPVVSIRLAIIMRALRKEPSATKSLSYTRTERAVTSRSIHHVDYNNTE